MYRNPDAKRAFHRTAKRALKELATALGLVELEYDLRVNRGGPDSSGDVALHTERLYVQIAAQTGLPSVLFRRCQGRKDYMGGPNNFVEVAKLGDPEFIARLKNWQAGG
jgi:hypothetical protein